MFNGISVSAAFGVSDEEFAHWLSETSVRRDWMAIKFSEFNGKEFDIRTMTWKEGDK